MPPKGRGKGRGGARGKGKATKRKKGEDEEEAEVTLNVPSDTEEQVTSRRQPVVSSPTPSVHSSHGGSQESDGSEAGPSGSSGARRKKRAKAGPIQFTTDVQENLAQWYRHNEMLYDKRHPDYANKAKKLTLFEQKSKDLDIPVPDIQKWLTGMRDRVGKILGGKVKKSGDSDQEPGGEELLLTPRDQWIKDNFEFLARHITRQKKETISLGTRRVPTSASPPTTSTPVPVSDTDSAGPTQGNTTCGSQAAVSALSATSELLNVAKSFQQALQPQPPQPRSAEEAAKRHMAEYLFHEACQMPTGRWNRFNMEIMRLILRFKQEQLDEELAAPPTTTAAYYYPQQPQQQQADEYFARPLVPVTSLSYYQQQPQQQYYQQPNYPMTTPAATTTRMAPATVTTGAGGLTYHTLQPVRRSPTPQPSTSGTASAGRYDDVSATPSSRPSSRGPLGSRDISPIPPATTAQVAPSTTATSTSGSFQPGALFARARTHRTSTPVDTPLDTPPAPADNNSMSSGARTPILAAPPTPGTATDLLRQAAHVTGVDSPGFLSQFVGTPSADVPAGDDGDGSFISSLLESGQEEHDDT